MFVKKGDKMSRDLIEEAFKVRGYAKLTSFWGGKEHKRCVQLTVPYEGYCQMTYDEAISFFNQCIDEITKIDKRYNENPPWWEELSELS